MSEFTVKPEDVAAAGQRLSGISDEVMTVHGTIGGLSGGADGTAASGAFEEMIGQWTTMLPHFARSGAGLSANVAAAAAAYSAADQGVARAASDHPSNPS